MNSTFLNKNLIQFTLRIRARQDTTWTDIVKFMVLIFLLLTSWTKVALGQPQSTEQAPMTFEQSFQQGVKFYQTKDFNKAYSSFEIALKEKPHHIALLTNLGLVSYELGKKGLALGYLRRALELEADFGPAEQAYDYVWSQLEVKEIPHRIETYETLRQYFLKNVSLSSYLFLGGLCFFISGWLLIRYFGQRKRALENELPLPAAPTVGLMLAFIFILLFSLSNLKVYDLNLVRGILIAEKIPMFMAPQDNEASLFELSQGLEVLVLKTDGDWIQIAYPGGPTGWIKKAQLILTSLGSF